MTLPRVLTIAGSDSGGGAGIQADLKTFTVLGAYGMSALTAVTAQNTLGVQGIYPLSPAAVAQQLTSVLSDIGADAAKTGMLFSAAIIEAVAEKVKEFGLTRLVVDPVMVAKGGARLLEDSAAAALREKLLPLASVVTPNLPEAEVLAAMPIREVADMQEAARRIVALGARAVVVKGGHLAGPPLDLLYDGSAFHQFTGERYPTKNTHGTGCTFSAALAVGLARGLALPAAVAQAKAFTAAAIRGAAPLGHGHGPTNHLAWLAGHRGKEGQ
ncbi:MAG TPA: bifunctional hydroxymethylpyrimidine kinase/phosphomethylpyrimidine kinase [Firmicutes bacterium]|nr:bifunctional hydroxymethylpyrimidine kinase/phosphomethylpyrimidine kinase [Bacillota bacterium]